MNPDLARRATAVPAGELRRDLFRNAAHPWFGDGNDLAFYMTETRRCWDALTDAKRRGDGGGGGCPISFSDDEVQAITDTWDKRRAVRARFDELDITADTETRSRDSRLDTVIAQWKAEEVEAAAAVSEEERRLVEEQWAFDDHDEDAEA